jgi:hypothetical protein
MVNLPGLYTWIYSSEDKRCFKVKLEDFTSKAKILVVRKTFSGGFEPLPLYAI